MSPKEVGATGVSGFEFKALSVRVAALQDEVTRLKHLVEEPTYGRDRAEGSSKRQRLVCNCIDLR